MTPMTAPMITARKNKNITTLSPPFLSFCVNENIIYDCKKQTDEEEELLLVLPPLRRLLPPPP
jgi:hypothetical protein